jgi:hypothetical protein
VHHHAAAHLLGGVVELRLRDRDDLRLLPVLGVEAAGVLRERPVQRVDERHRDAIGHRQRGVADVVVDHVERVAALAGRLDLREGAGDVVGLVLRLLDVIRMRVVQHLDDVGARLRAGRREQRHVVTAGDKTLAQQAHHLLDPPVRGRGHRNPGRCEHGDPHGVNLPCPGAPRSA